MDRLPELGRDHVVIPLHLFHAMAAAYYGDGPRLGEKRTPPASEATTLEGDSPEPRQTTTIPVEGLLDGRLSSTPFGLKPMGTARKEKPVVEADEE